MDAGETSLLLIYGQIFVDPTGWRINPGRIRIPPGEIDKHLHLLDKDKWIVMYCT